MRPKLSFRASLSFRVEQRKCIHRSSVVITHFLPLFFTTLFFLHVVISPWQQHGPKLWAASIKKNAVMDGDWQTHLRFSAGHFSAARLSLFHPSKKNCHRIRVVERVLLVLFALLYFIFTRVRLNCPIAYRGSTERNGGNPTSVWNGRPSFGTASRWRFNNLVYFCVTL